MVAYKLLCVIVSYVQPDGSIYAKWKSAHIRIQKTILNV